MAETADNAEVMTDENAGYSSGVYTRGCRSCHRDFREQARFFRVFRCATRSIAAKPHIFIKRYAKEFVALNDERRAIIHCYARISRKELFLSGNNIGRSVIGTMTTTLLLAYNGRVSGHADAPYADSPDEHDVD